MLWKFTLVDKDQWVGVEIIHIQELLGTKIAHNAIQKVFELFLAIHAKMTEKSWNKYGSFTLSYKQQKIRSIIALSDQIYCV